MSLPDVVLAMRPGIAPTATRRLEVDVTRYTVDPLSPVGNEKFLLTPLQSDIPLGDFDIRLHGIDRRRFDPTMHAAVLQWMEGWSFDGEMGLISRNDALLRIIDHLAEFTFKVRDRHDTSTVGTKRSDATLGINGCALLLVEEKDLTGIEPAESDLRKKFQWIPHFHLLPFVFGMAITRNALAVYALKRSGEPKRLFYTRLNSDANRWSCVGVSVNIARVLCHFTANKVRIRAILALLFLSLSFSHLISICSRPSCFAR